MKFVIYQSFPTSAASPSSALGLLVSGGIVPLGDLATGDSPQAALEGLIDSFDEIRRRLESLAAGGTPIPTAAVRLCAPVPRPGKILCTTAVYAAGASADRQQLLMTLKSAESVVGPRDTIRLPNVGEAWQFVPQAALGVVIRGRAKQIKAADWRSAVFGYTCVVDVMARGDQQFGRDFWLAKADTLGPLGPCVVTADEVPDPAVLHVRSWQNGSAAQDYAIANASHSIGEQVEFATTVMTLHSGDVLACGTSPDGQRPLADGDDVAIEIEGIGRLELAVSRASRPVTTRAVGSNA